MKIIVAFITGLIFALGLGISGMTKVQVVKGFLDVFGNWNPALVGVMVGAIVVNSLFFFFTKKRSSPIFDTNFHLPTNKKLDARLIIGSALFGIGWGWAGICPGPGIVAMMSGNKNIIIFVTSMIVGMLFFKLFSKRF